MLSFAHGINLSVSGRAYESEIRAISPTVTFVTFDLPEDRTDLAQGQGGRCNKQEVPCTIPADDDIVPGGLDRQGQEVPHLYDRSEPVD